MKRFLFIFLIVFMFVGCKKAAPPEPISPEDPGLPKPNYYNIAFGQIRKGEHELAKKNLTKHIEHNQNDIRAYVSLANVQMRDGQHEEAKNILVKAVRMDPKNPDGHFLLAQCYAKLENYSEAEKSMKTAMDIYIANDDSDSYQNAALFIKILKKMSDDCDQCQK